jgi:pilus assembly protein CpaE
MKITVVSSDLRQVESIKLHLSTEDKRHVVTCLAGDAANLQDAFSSEPDVVIFAEAGSMQNMLAHVDAVTTRHPAVQVIIASEQQSPEFLRSAMRAGAREVLPLPLSKPLLDEALSSIEKKMASGRKAREDGKVFAFIGCKGGAGTTFLATNWAHVCAIDSTRRVAFIDLNRQFGDALFYLSDEVPAMDLADLAKEAARLDGSLLTGSMVPVRANLHLLAAAETPEKAQCIGVDEMAAVLKHAAREYDLVIVDVGNVVDQISALAMDVADRVYPVMQATVPYVRAASRLLKVLKAYPRDKIEWIVNRYEEQGDVSLRDLEHALGHGELRTIAGSFRTVSASISQGVPLAELDKRDRVLRDLQTWAASIFPTHPVPRQTDGWMKRLIPKPRHSERAPASNA